jgi:hypothetical protein
MDETHPAGQQSMVTKPPWCWQTSACAHVNGIDRSISNMAVPTIAVLVLSMHNNPVRPTRIRGRGQGYVLQAAPAQTWSTPSRGLPETCPVWR